VGGIDWPSHSVAETAAKKVHSASGFDPGFLMRMQNSYDIAQARKREAEIKVERYTGMITKGRA